MSTINFVKNLLEDAMSVVSDASALPTKMYLLIALPLALKLFKKMILVPIHANDFH